MATNKLVEHLESALTELAEALGKIDRLAAALVGNQPLTVEETRAVEAYWREGVPAARHNIEASLRIVRTRATR